MIKIGFQSDTWLRVILHLARKSWASSKPKPVPAKTNFLAQDGIRTRVACVASDCAIHDSMPLGRVD